MPNLPTKDAIAQQVMQLYRERWQIERLFLTVLQLASGSVKSPSLKWRVELMQWLDFYQILCLHYLR